ncbi:conserved unknown protein [Ectocarpus siliculosus]|uniref:Thioredoxin domain-containing protein n=1 Tax=Ectocarpus siliculosus TaxID=2880 RepID=D8LU97_ECTSI|nr:conserved unknown protein [Ectocarpus siliculosus]|eukprot:CBN75438.1 conserved unknown protein [Ectocarpus siliculosus]
MMCWKTSLLLLMCCSSFRMSTAFLCGTISGGSYHDRQQLVVAAAMEAAATRGSSTISVQIKHSTRNPVDAYQLSGCGSTFYASGYDQNGNKDGLVLMQTISGVLDDGREVIGVVKPGKYPGGGSVLVEERHLVDKPQGLGWDKAAMLPFLAISCLWPLSEAGFGDSMDAGQTFVVTGGHGSLAPFVVAVLKAWGGRVALATTKSEGGARALGADLAVDFRKESYSDVVQDFSAVVDTLGREKEGPQDMLKEARGAEYVSLQPSILKVAVEDGLLFGSGKILQYQKTVAKDDSRTYFLPNPEAVGLVSQVSALVAAGKVRLGEVGTDYVGMQEYLEALAWPKDTDTGLRFGFPGKTNRSWGWLGGDSLDERLAWEDEDEEEEDEWEGEAGEGDGGRAVSPTGEVVGLKSREDLKDLVREGGTMIFVSSRSCRACKYLTPFYRKLARRQEQVLFGRVDASSHPELARQLGLTAVPSFVTFREGEVVTSKATSSKKNIEKLVEELLYE